MFRTNVRSNIKRSQATQRAWSVQRDHEKIVDGGERQLHQFGIGLRDVAIIKTDSSRRSDHDRVGQCGVSALQVGSKFGGGTRHHVVVLAELFAELELDRTIVEIREKAIAE